MSNFYRVMWFVAAWRAHTRRKEIRRLRAEAQKH